MPKNPIIPPIFVTFLLFGACSTGRFNISILEPAPYTFPTGLHRVTILPITGMDKSQVALNKPIIDGMYDALKASPLFQKVVIANDSVLIHLIADSILNWRDIDKLCKHDTSDVLLILRDAYKKDSINDFGDGYMNYFMFNQVTWELYNPYTMQEMVKFVYSDTSDVYHDVGIQYIEDIKREIGYWTGYKAGIKISPQWKTIRRTYFKGPGSDMRKAARLVRNNLWNDAAIIWDRVAEGSNNNKIAKASHNIALAYERDDILDQALYWEQYADSLSHKPVILTYRKELEDRIRKKTKLDEQMIGE
jgi:hypothetical protein